MAFLLLSLRYGNLPQFLATRIDERTPDFFKGNDLFCPLSFDELSHWHFPSSPGQDPILNFFPELSGTSTYTISADVDGVGVGELEKILRGMF